MGYEWADGGLRSPKEQGHSTLVQGEPPGVRASWILRIRSLSLTHSCTPSLPPSPSLSLTYSLLLSLSLSLSVFLSLPRWFSLRKPPLSTGRDVSHGPIALSHKMLQCGHQQCSIGCLYSPPDFLNPLCYAF